MTVKNGPTADLIPLSHFALDYPQPPEGWALFLGRHAIKLRLMIWAAIAFAVVTRSVFWMSVGPTS